MLGFAVLHKCVQAMQSASLTFSVDVNFLSVHAVAGVRVTHTVEYCIAANVLQESVRSAAELLAKNLRSLTLRLADRSQTPPGEATAAVSCALPLLLTKGMPSSVAEVQGLALDTLVKMVKLAGPEVVRPHLPELTGVMLESLSGLEVCTCGLCQGSAVQTDLTCQQLVSRMLDMGQSDAFTGGGHY